METPAITIEGQIMSADIIDHVPVFIKGVVGFKHQQRGRLTRDQVVDIFLSTKPAKVTAREFGVSLYTVYKIKSRRNYNRFTANLKRS